MANPTFNTGLVPRRLKDGRNYDGQANLYCLLSTYATAVYLGDPVVRVGGANTSAITTANAVFPAGDLPVVQKATLGTGAITGVIVGFAPVVDSLHTMHGAASTTRVVMVADDPDIIFHIRDDGYATPIGTAGVGHNAILIAGTANTDNSCSGVRLDGGTGTAPAATQSTYQLLITRVARIPNNDPTLKNCVWEVRINVHTEANGAGVVGY